MRLATLAALLLPTFAHGATFEFGSNNDPNDGFPQATLSVEGVTIQLDAASADGVPRIDGSGVGVDSSGLAGAVDDAPKKFNLLAGAAAGMTESMTFRFDHPGVLTGLDLDGVKDESFEYFQLDTPGGETLTIFDSQIGLRLLDLSLLALPNLTLLTEAGPADDDLFGLAIPFAAGDTFTLTYGEHHPSPSNYVPGFSPLTGNGARFFGVTIMPVPEPTTVVGACVCLGFAGRGGPR